MANIEDNNELLSDEEADPETASIVHEGERDERSDEEVSVIVNASIDDYVAEGHGSEAKKSRHHSEQQLSTELKLQEPSVKVEKKVKKPIDKRKQLAKAREAAKRNRESGANESLATKKLVLPHRAIKRIMKLDKGVGKIQNEAVLLATYASELFVKKLVKESHKHAKQRGRNIIRYEDVAEARAANENLTFLDTLLP
mmetsp:Transcript_29482/g.33916  ORF Transcript_29482/g.33916 Transcript_29482/m.33916 type:complete len:198 (+) Transcript_29482:40-633(+)|eukprot:CAMPEP_0194354090 /NCGR_PEP_ID=MMETSP0174-20130528/2276_1 /TAXON_ID=216777 /ORGANISM="Proboscia alata, Strain PI-D3" /LENGTH=197 /DNA_ID=CAMNT_0039122861 /DNA_START=37 /DNA_END=630 /DNA_ORIENTATION=-